MMPLNLEMGRNLRDAVIQKSYSIRNCICKISGKLASASLHLPEQFCLQKVHILGRQLDLLGSFLPHIKHSLPSETFLSSILGRLLCAAALLETAWVPPWVPSSGSAFLQVPGSMRTLGDTAVMCQALPDYREAGWGLGQLHGCPGLSPL